LLFLEIRQGFPRKIALPEKKSDGNLRTLIDLVLP
jgi:hypothetical protein